MTQVERQSGPFCHRTSKVENDLLHRPAEHSQNPNESIALQFKARATDDRVLHKIFQALLHW